METNKTILIVEYELIIANDILWALREMDYNVAGIATDNHEAFQLLDTKQINLILLDINITGNMDGIELATIIGKKYDLPVIFLTSQTEQSLIREAMEAKPYGYLYKPISHNEIKTTIEMALYKYEMEQKLKKSEALYKTIFDSTGTATLTLTSDLKIKMVNKKTLELAESSEEELLNQKDPIKFVSPKYRDMVISNFKKRIQGDKSIPEQYEFDFVTAKGNFRRVMLTGNYLEESGETILSLIDITEKVQAEKSFEHLFENIPDAVFISTANTHKILDVNYAAEKQTGYTKSELMAINISKDIAVPGQIINLDYTKMEDGETLRFHEQKIRKNGSLYWTEVVMTYVYQGDEKLILSVNRDITEELQREEEIRHSKEELQSLIENLKEIVWRSDIEGNITYISRTIFNSDTDIQQGDIEFIRKNIIGKNMLEFIFAPDKPMIEASLKELSKGKSICVDFRMLDTNNQIHWQRVNASRIRQQDATFGLLGTLRDITKEKQNEIALEKSEERYRLLAETAQDIIIIYNKNGLITYTNNSTEKILGYDPEYLLGKKIFRFVPNQYQQGIKEKIKSNITNIENQLFEIKLTARNKKEIDFEISSTVFTQEDGEKFVLIIGRDITNRKQIERRIKESEKKIRAYVENSPNAIFIYNSNMDIIEINKRACELLQYSRDELLQMELKDIDLHEQNGLHKQHTSDNNKLHSILRKKDGNEFPVEIFVSSFDSEDGEMTIASVIDITERRKRELELAYVIFLIH